MAVRFFVQDGTISFTVDKRQGRHLLCLFVEDLTAGEVAAEQKKIAGRVSALLVAKRAMMIRRDICNGRTSEFVSAQADFGEAELYAALQHMENLSAAADGGSVHYIETKDVGEADGGLQGVGV